ncbi:group III truncated hemoglobin [Pseudonocardia halophobica]|uniref:group III truncated hemoglobin n=1 Tax=Pseudonocardia halophobica TaxID=29401 RepID=UPI003D8C8E44
MSAGSLRHDIADRDDIADLVDEFYRRVFSDEVLGPIFVEVARVDLSAHLPVMCDFWSTVLLRDGTYHRNALRPHLDLYARCELTEAHFARWRALWTATVDQQHAGKRAELAKSQATRIAGAIRRRLPGAQASELLTLLPQHLEQGMP